MAFLYGRNGRRDEFAGTDEDDELYGYAMGGNPWTADAGDELWGRGGDDYLSGGWGDDWLFGGSENDELEGGPGGDWLDGGPGFDTALYWAARSGVVLSLSTVGRFTGEGSVGDAAGDRLVSIEKVIGSFYDDTITGDDDGNVLNGFLGDDTLRGGRGVDELYGDEGVDHLYGEDSDDFLYGGSNTDHLWGDDGDDTLDGGDGDDFQYGGMGDDTFVGSRGADTFGSGDESGIDLADYSPSTAGVQVDLATSRGTGGFAAGDRYDGIENVTGSRFGDTITGDGWSNVLRGGDGVDVIAGGGGNDVVIGGAGADQLDGGSHTTTGDDLSYQFSSTGVWVDLSLGSGRGGDAEGDKFLRFENLTGSSHKDTLLGDRGDNFIDGKSGSDELHGNEGADILMGGAHEDHLWGDGGADSLWGGSSNDTFHYARLSDSPYSIPGVPETFDTIHDFRKGDKIDLSAIDANTTAGAVGNQAFFVVDTLSGSGQLRILNLGDEITLVVGETNGVGTPDIMIKVMGHVDEGDFVF